MVTALLAVSATTAVVVGLRASRASRTATYRLPPGTCPCGRSHDASPAMTAPVAA